MSGCLVALYKRQTQMVHEMCEFHPKSVEEWVLERFEGNTAFMTVYKPLELVLKGANETKLRQLGVGGYRLRLVAGQTIELGQWVMHGKMDFYDETPLTIKPALSPSSDDRLNRTVEAFRKISLERPIRLSKLATLQKIRTGFQLSWTWILVLTLLGLAAIALAIAYVVYKVRMTRMGLSAGPRRAPNGGLQDELKTFHQTVQSII